MTFKKSNIPKNKLPDTLAACRLIKRQRKFSRLKKIKRISVRLEDVRVTAVTNIHYYPPTNSISFSHCLYSNRCSFYPTTNKRLKCTNQHALDMLNKKREKNKRHKR